MKTSQKTSSKLLLLTIVIVTLLVSADAHWYRKSYGYKGGYGYRKSDGYRNPYYKKSYTPHYGQDSTVYVKKIYVPIFIKHHEAQDNNHGAIITKGNNHIHEPAAKDYTKNGPAGQHSPGHYNNHNNDHYKPHPYPQHQKAAGYGGKAVGGEGGGVSVYAGAGVKAGSGMNSGLLRTFGLGALPGGVRVGSVYGGPGSYGPRNLLG